MNIKSTLILASLGLSLFYIYVLVLLLNPAVSEQYQRYYISRESRVSAAELAALDEIVPGEEVGFDSGKLAFDGWSNAEQEFRWSLGHSPSLHFALDDTVDAERVRELVLRFRPLERQRVSILINEQPVLAEEYSGSNIFDVVIIVPAGLLRQGTNTLQFELPDARLPGNGDTRELGLALFSLRFKQA